MRRPGPALASSSRAALPRWRSGSSSSVWRRATTPKCQARLVGDRGRADAAAHAGHGHEAAGMDRLGGAAARREQRREMPRDHVAGERLVEIFERAQAAGDVAVEVHVVLLADHQHAHVGLDHLRECAERGQRLLLAAHIDHQHARRGRPLEGRDRGAHVAAPHLEARRRRVGKPLAQRRLGGSIGDEGEQGNLVGARDRLDRRRRQASRDGGRVVGHQFPARAAAGRGARTHARTRARALIGARAAAAADDAGRDRSDLPGAEAPHRVGRFGAVRAGVAVAAHQVERIGDHRREVGRVGAVGMPLAVCVVVAGRMLLAAGEQRRSGEHRAGASCANWPTGTTSEPLPPAPSRNGRGSSGPTPPPLAGGGWGRGVAATRWVAMKDVPPHCTMNPVSAGRWPGSAVPALPTWRSSSRRCRSSGGE